ncbi:DUF3013 family protein [Tuanshanicoccus lijuaniae]|uniref:DUF3013 family protein n=1 Tax=Aerococcaceae bacterium zg-1292 TaxID=2774330 RepID=UPI001936E8FC|nr:DUF3013 family protein [Aerococcaceae bacterium zg-1292]MBF6977662.1 DUF3013 family protein [Aerococcaceae bacterium zg-BR22]QQA36460.1 DUF3013 family protein [Aerococcaceae bacterium zg-1292]
MKRQDLLEQLKRMLDATYFHYEWQLTWEEDWPYIELKFQLVLPNQQIQPITVLFYDLERVKIVAGDYLYAAAVDHHEGIAVGEVNAVILFLRQLLAGARVKFLESVSSEFHLEWDELAFKQFRQSLIASHRYNEQRLLFPEVE